MSKNTEDYIWAMQHAYCLLNADVQFWGALARLPAGGIECETLVEKAVSIIREALGDDVPPLEVSSATVRVALESSNADHETNAANDFAARGEHMPGVTD